MIKEQFLQRVAEELCRKEDLGEDYIRRNKDSLPWNYISRFQPLSLNFIREFKDYVDWRELSQNDKIKFDIEFVREFEDKLCWCYISEHPVFTGCEKNINEYNTKVDYVALQPHLYHYTPKLLERFEENFEWVWINPNWYDEKFLDKHADNFRLRTISFQEKEGAPRQWEEWFVEKYNEILNFQHLASNQDLSEDFMRKFADRLDWCVVSRKQKMSIEFIREFYDRIKWNLLPFNSNITNEILNEFKLETKKFPT